MNREAKGAPNDCLKRLLAPNNHQPQSSPGLSHHSLKPVVVGKRLWGHLGEDSGGDFSPRAPGIELHR